MTLADYRKSIGKTQDEIATLLKIDRTTVSTWESGKAYPHPIKISFLAKLFGISEGDIINAITEANKAKEVLQ